MASDPSRSGWLDEFWTIILAAPFVLAFVPGAQDVVRTGFTILRDNVPPWYQAGMGVAVAWGFARDRLPSIVGRFARRGS